MNEFLENSYVSKLITSGFVEVDSINLPDGSYPKSGGGYQIEVLDIENFAAFAAQSPSQRMYYGTNEHNGYVIVTKDGIRGFYNPSNDAVIIKDGKPIGVNIYKIFSKKVSDLRNEKINQVIDDKRD